MIKSNFEICCVHVGRTALVKVYYIVFTNILFIFAGPALAFVIIFKGKTDDIDRKVFEDSLLLLFVNNGDLSPDAVLRSTYQECDGPNG